MVNAIKLLSLKIFDTRYNNAPGLFSLHQQGIFMHITAFKLVRDM